MASRPEDSVPEQQQNPELEEKPETEPGISYENWDKVIDQTDLLEAYDTVVEVYNGSKYLEDDNIEAVGEEVLIPNSGAYDGEGESLEALKGRLDGDSLVVAFGFDGEDLPNYRELLDPDMNAEGNWWDNPEELDVDYLFDDTTYSGAVNVPGFESRHIMPLNEGTREVYVVSES
ncbi:MAG: hypothetical protein ABEK04_02930 [Candidatus Nanohalobium sp.]